MDNAIDGFALWLAGTFAATFLLSCLGTRALIPLLRRQAVLAQPNERSSHRVPTPIGGGIALVMALLLGWVALSRAGWTTPGLGIIPVATSLLAVVSWLDDLRDLSPGLRLLAQIAAVALGCAALPPGGTVFQGWLPAPVDTIAAGLVWVWFVNLFNFMDGIDGLAGSETVAIGAGLLLFAVLGAGSDRGAALLATVVIAAALGFLAWNWAPARIFLGDVGSVPVGYLLGFLLLDLAARGWWKVALILPLYFLADATITLLRRLCRGERIWQAHREHFYQRALRPAPLGPGLDHAAIVRRVVLADLLLIGCGWAAENGAGLAGLAAAAAIVAALLRVLTHPRDEPHHAPKGGPVGSSVGGLARDPGRPYTRRADPAFDAIRLNGSAEDRPGASR
jgi:UDP-N-acetylmuramyl pentapeptide phosphotransferase/UDP-N-acetylglucosamine-1-phosphate transferase